MVRTGKKNDHFESKSKGTALLLMFYISVTAGSSTMSITHTIK
jgi:hypothetical protein